MTILKLFSLSTIIIFNASFRAWPVESLMESRGILIVDHKTISILKNCYNDRLNPLLIVGNDDKFHERDFDDIPVILINDDYQKFIPHQYIKLETVLLRPETTDQLEGSFRLLKKFNLWNAEASFLIKSHNCQNAMEFMKLAWRMSLLSSIFLCPVDNEVKMFTYNPYTNRAPLVWKKEDTPSEPDGRWTLYSQLYTEGETSCEYLDFDKREFLDGYKVRVIANVETTVSWTPKQDYTIDSLQTKMRYDKAQYFNTLFTTLNVTPIINYDLNSYEPQVMADALDPLNGSMDILLSTHDIVVAPEYNVSSVYPYCVSDSGLVTRHRGFLSPAEKIAEFYSTRILCLTGLVLIISLFALTFHKRRGLIPAFLEILRMTFGTSFYYPLRSDSMRIYFLPVFLLVLILNTSFQGNLIKFLTKPEHRRDVQSIEDLRRLKFHVYASNLISGFLLPPDWPEQYLHHSKHMNCSLFVIENVNAACIAPLSFLPLVTLSSHLHFLKLTPPIEHYLQAWTRPDWPLIRKCNDITVKLWSSGLQRHWEDRVITGPFKRVAAKFVEETMPTIRKLKTQDFVFSFICLGVGLVCAIVVFLIEVLTRIRLRGPRWFQRSAGRD